MDNKIWVTINEKLNDYKRRLNNLIKKIKNVEKKDFIKELENFTKSKEFRNDDAKYQKGNHLSDTNKGNFDNFENKQNKKFYDKRRKLNDLIKKIKSGEKSDKGRHDINNNKIYSKNSKNSSLKNPFSKLFDLNNHSPKSFRDKMNKLYDSNNMSSNSLSKQYSKHNKQIQWRSLLYFG